MAQQRIQDGKFEGLQHQDVYDLWMAAYGDRRLAEQARTQFLEEYVRESCNAAS